MKQTAVEWLVEQMIERKYFAKDVPLSYTTLEHLVNQAKEMEKEQIEDAFQDGKWDWAEHIEKGIESKDLAIYYQETYGKTA